MDGIILWNNMRRMAFKIYMMDMYLESVKLIGVSEISGNFSYEID